MARKLNRKDYFLLARDLFEELLYESPGVSDYLPQLIEWTTQEIKKIDSQKESQRIKRQITRVDQDWDEIMNEVYDLMRKRAGHFFRPTDIFSAVGHDHVFSEEQLSYRLRKAYNDGLIVRKQVPSAKSANMVWGYAIPKEDE